MSKPIKIIEYKGKKYGSFIDRRLSYPCKQCCFYNDCLTMSISKLREFSMITDCYFRYDTYYKEISE
jgi:hypothetical protein